MFDTGNTSQNIGKVAASVDPNDRVRAVADRDWRAFARKEARKTLGTSRAESGIRSIYGRC